MALIKKMTKSDHECYDVYRSYADNDDDHDDAVNNDDDDVGDDDGDEDDHGSAKIMRQLFLSFSVII